MSKAGIVFAKVVNQVVTLIIRLGFLFVHQILALDHRAHHCLNHSLVIIDNLNARVIIINLKFKHKRLIAHSKYQTTPNVMFLSLSCCYEVSQPWVQD